MNDTGLALQHAGAAELLCVCELFTRGRVEGPHAAGSCGTFPRLLCTPASTFILTD